MSQPEAKPTAASKVFGVVELLEQILFQAVEVSVPAISSLETVHDPARREHARSMRWILTSAMRVNRAWCSTIKTSPAIQVAMFNNPDCKKQNGGEIRFNSLLLEVFPECFKTQDLTKNLPCLKARHDRAVARCNASWRAMFPVLPQMHSIRVSKTEYGGYYNYDDIGVVNSVNLPHTTNRFDMFALYSLVHGIWISAPCRQYTIRYHTFCDPDGKNPMYVSPRAIHSI